MATHNQKPSRLPFADEVRAARAEFGESSRAKAFLYRLTAALQSLSVLERQHAMGVDLSATPFPGGELIAEIAETWPALSDLPSVGPRAGTSLLEQLHARKTQLESAQQMLKPIMRAFDARLEALQRIQAEQRAQIGQPGFEEILQGVQRLVEERDRVLHGYEPIQQQLSFARPTLGLVGVFAERVAREEKAGRAVDDPTGAVAWRTAYLAAEFLHSIAESLESAGFSAPIPALPALPEQPEPSRSEACWENVARIRSLLADLEAHAGAEMRRMDALVEAGRHEYAALTARLEDITG